MRDPRLTISLPTPTRIGSSVLLERPVRDSKISIDVRARRDKVMRMKETHEWTGLGPQLQVETLSDGSKVYNVTITDETIFCLDERHALQLIEDLNEVARRAV